MASDVPPEAPKKVCVVGAGMAGLAAARELRREDHAVTVMEQGRDIGGQWLYDPRADAGDGDPPVVGHSSMYASARLLSARETMGFSDFQFVPRPGAGRDARRFPGHREVYCYLQDFRDAFGLAGAVRLNTRVTRVAMEGGGAGGGGLCRWQVRSVLLEPDSGAEVACRQEVFDAVVVANGHYSQPRLPSIRGMAGWRRRQLHSHSYRVPEPFRSEVVVLVGCGESGLDIALDLLRGGAKEVHLSARSVAQATTPAVAKMLANHGGRLRLHPQVDRLCTDGQVVFADGASVAADTVIYRTGYAYSFPFLDTGGAVTVDDNRVGPLFEHTFPPALAPSLSFVGIPMRVFAPWFFEAQARWVARALSGRAALPSPEDMTRAVREDYRAREAAGLATKYAHEIGGFKPEEVCGFVYRRTDMPRMEDWKIELSIAAVRDVVDGDRETFRDRDDGDYSDKIREGLQRWRCLAAAQYQAALDAGAGCAAAIAGSIAPLTFPSRQASSTSGPAAFERPPAGLL